MVNGTLLWVDDEMELLKAYVIFLVKKDYEVVTATNGQDALDLCRERSFDLIFLDENTPTEWTGDFVTHQGNLSNHACCDGDEERGGKYHESGHRLEDCRLPD